MSLLPCERIGEGKRAGLRIGLRLVFPGLIALAAGCPSHSTPTPVLKGVLESASGSGAPLTFGDTAVGSGFSMLATLGTNQVIRGKGEWHCFAPDPLQFASYGIQATDNENFGLFITVATTTGWMVGAHPIDGVNITLLVVGPDSFGQATSGTLMLTGAPLVADSSGNSCAFSIAGPVPLFGYPN